MVVEGQAAWLSGECRDYNNALLVVRFLLFFSVYQLDSALKQQRSAATYSISSPHQFGKGKEEVNGYFTFLKGRCH